MENCSILIVDDNHINRELCSLNLQPLGVPVYGATNGRQGLAMAKELHPDVIILDLMMPIMDGFEMLRQLKEDENLQHIAVLILTAKSDTKSIVKALEQGADDYLKKPFAEEEMVARVKTLLRNRYLEKRLAEDLLAGAKMQQKFLTDRGTAELHCRNAAIEVEIFNRPYGTISGDFYYCFRQPDDVMGLFLGDSSGHGLPAALMSMRITGFLERLSGQAQGAAEILTILNNDIAGLFPIGKFVAAAILLFDRNTVTISNAGQPYPMLINQDGLRELEGGGFPLGLVEDSDYREETFPFFPGDTLLLHTDGITEAMSTAGEMFGRQRLRRCIEKNAGASGIELRRRILTDLEGFSGTASPDDDQTMLILKKCHLPLGG